LSPRVRTVRTSCCSNQPPQISWRAVGRAAQTVTTSPSIVSNLLCHFQKNQSAKYITQVQPTFFFGPNACNDAFERTGCAPVTSANSPLQSSNSKRRRINPPSAIQPTKRNTRSKPSEEAKNTLHTEPDRRDAPFPRKEGEYEEESAQNLRRKRKTRLLTDEEV